MKKEILEQQQIGGRTDIAILTPKNGNGKLYEYIGDVDGGHKFKNITDGSQGILTTEQAKTMFKIPMPINVICNEYPTVLSLIKQLNLAMYKIN